MPENATGTHNWLAKMLVSDYLKESVRFGIKYLNLPTFKDNSEVEVRILSLGFVFD